MLREQHIDPGTSQVDSEPEMGRTRKKQVNSNDYPSRVESTQFSLVVKNCDLNQIK